MGCFSWLDENGKAINIGDECYLLTPFGKIHEPSYDGYGRFGECDVFIEVAKWHQKLDVKQGCNLASDDLWERYRNGETLTDEEYRTVGIDIACYDNDNAALHYPIKVTHDERIDYDDFSFSPSDPNQGFGNDDDDWDEEDDDIWDD